MQITRAFLKIKSPLYTTQNFCDLFLKNTFFFLNHDFFLKNDTKMGIFKVNFEKKGVPKMIKKVYFLKKNHDFFFKKVIFYFFF